MGPINTDNLSQIEISPRLKHKVDKYVGYVNIVNVVLFTKTSIKLDTFVENIISIQ